MSDESTRPWGHYEILSEAADFKTKTITVQPGKRLSYQKHQHRAEHWFVVRGTGTVVLDGVEKVLSPGDSVDIPLGAAHRMWNRSDAEVVFVEVQTGTSFGEDDIVRLEDDFGR